MQHGFLIAAFAALIAVTTVSAVTTARPESCPKNSSWTTCATACEPTCAKPKVDACIEICKPAQCQCDKDFVRNAQGDCVKVDDCPANSGKPPKCPDNESWKECASACEPSCNKPENMACILMCMPARCQCDAGFVRDGNGDCVAKDQCTGGRLTCANVRCMSGTECKMVQVQCIRAPCPPRPQCVPFNSTEEKCTAKCHAGEKCVLEQVVCKKAPCRPVPRCVPEGYLPGGGGAGCAATTCLVGSECVEDENGKATCKPPTKDDRCTGANEYFNSCGGCEAKCGDKEPRMCPMICKLEGACRCKDGFYRNVAGKCVTQNECESEVTTTEEPGATCELVDCRSGMDCVMATNKLCGKPSCPKKPMCIPQNITSCKTAKCARGKKCEMIQVQCFAPPCYPVPECVDDPEQRPILTCATMLCIPGHVCINSPTGGRCVPSPIVEPVTPEGVTTRRKRATCASIRCKSGFECVMATQLCRNKPCPKTPACIPQNSNSCKTMRCSKGQKCEMIQVQCFAAPCYPIPQCVEDPEQQDPCATIRCKEGYVCKRLVINCIRAPCPQPNEGYCAPINE